MGRGPLGLWVLVHRVLGSSLGTYFSFFAVLFSGRYHLSSGLFLLLAVNKVCIPGSHRYYLLELFPVRPNVIL